MYILTQHRRRKATFLGNCEIAYFLLHTLLIAFTVVSLFHDFQPRIICLVVAGVWKKQHIKFTNHDLLLMLKRENCSTKLKEMHYLCRYRWIRRVFTAVLCSKPSELSSREII